MSASKRNPHKKLSKNNPVVYSEFGNSSHAEAMEPGVRELPPQQQNLKVQATRKGRGGKTVTVISGFQTNSETLSKLLKQLKNQCGTGGTLKDETLEIQGDHTEKLVQLLGKLGYKAKKSGG